MGNPDGEGVSSDKQPPPEAAQPQSHPPLGYPPQNYPPQNYGPPGGYSWGYQPGPPPGPKPSSNIGWAIAAIFLFWPLCIPAFIFSSRVDTAWFVGDYYGAQRASADAKKFGMIGVIVGASLLTLYIVFFVVFFGVVLAGASHGTHTFHSYGN